MSTITEWTLLLDEGSASASATMPTIAAGGNRKVLIAIGMYNGGGAALPPATITTASITKNIVAGDTSPQTRATAALYTFNDSEIAAISGQTITSSGTGSQKSIFYKLLGDVDQIDPVVNRGYTSSSGVLTMPLSRSVSSQTEIFGFSSAGGATLTMSNPDRDGVVSLASGRRISWGSQDDTENTSDATVTGSFYTSAWVANFAPAPSQSITDVNGGAGVKIGSTGNVATVVGAPSAATGGTLGGKAITVTNWDSGTGVATFAAPSVVDGESFPEFNSNQTLVIIGSDWSASLSGIALNTPTGSTVVTIASPDIVDQRKLGYHFLNTLGVTVVGGDQFYGVDADVEWVPDTDGSATDLPVTTPVTLRDASTGIVYLLNVTVNPDGVVLPTYQKRYSQPGNLNPITGLWGSDPYIALPAQGAGFTLTGSGFGIKTGYSDHINTSGIYDLPVDSNFDIVGRWDGRNYQGASNRPVIKAEGIAGVKCLYSFQDVHGAPGRNPNNAIAFNYDTPIALGTTIFCSRFIKHNSNAVTGGQWKSDRWQAVASVSDKPNESYRNIKTDLGVNAVPVRDDDGSEAPSAKVLYGGGNAPIGQNKWCRIDTRIILPVSFEDRASYSHEEWIYDYDGIEAPHYNNFTDNQAVDLASPYSSEASLWTQHLYQNYFGNGDFGTSTHNLWTDKCFESIGDDKRLEFCNSPTWGSQTKSYTQPLGSWTGTSIEIEAFDRGDLTSGWLHVISNNTSIYSRRLG